MAVANTQAYYDTTTITAVKSFIVQESKVEQKSKKHRFVTKNKY
jgi:hypothetical protein